jgi:hypothetical protein
MNLILSTDRAARGVYSYSEERRELQQCDNRRRGYERVQRTEKEMRCEFEYY